MQWLGFGVLLATHILFVQWVVWQTQQVKQDTSENIEQTFSCGEYFMQKVSWLWLTFNRFFNDPYFVFKDCDGQEQRVFIACGCGATWYEITKYGRTYHENEQTHPELDRLLHVLESALRAGALQAKENSNGEMVYIVECL